MLEALVPSDRIVTTREKTGGRMLPSKEKNSKDTPLHRTAWMVQRKPLFSLSRSEAEDVLLVSAKHGKEEGEERTICYGDHLRDGVEPLVAGTDSQLEFDKANREGTADLKLVLDSATRCYPPRHDRFRCVPYREPKFGLDPAQELSRSVRINVRGKTVNVRRKSVNIRWKSGKSRIHRHKELRLGFLIAIPYWWAVLVDGTVHVANDLLESLGRDTRALNQECVAVAKIAKRIQPGQRGNFLEGYFAE